MEKVVKLAWQGQPAATAPQGHLLKTQPWNRMPCCNESDNLFLRMTLKWLRPSWWWLSSFLQSFLPIYYFPRRASNVLTELTSPKSKVLLSGFLPRRGISKQVCTSVKSLAVRLTLGLTPSLTQCKVGTMERGNSKPFICMLSKSLNASQRPADLVEKYKAASWIVAPSPPLVRLEPDPPWFHCSTRVHVSFYLNTSVFFLFFYPHSLLLLQPSWGQRNGTVGATELGGRKEQRIRCERRGAVLAVLHFLSGKKILNKSNGTELQLAISQRVFGSHLDDINTTANHSIPVSDVRVRPQALYRASIRGEHE